MRSVYNPNEYSNETFLIYTKMSNLKLLLIFLAGLHGLLVFNCNGRSFLEATMMEDRVRSQIDESKEPCEDLFRYSCGKATKSLWTAAQDEYDKQVIELLEDQEKFSNASRLLKEIRKLYNSCKYTANTPSLGTIGNRPLQMLIEKLGGFPIWRGEGIKAKGRPLADILMAFRLEGVDTNGLFRVEVRKHPADHAQHAGLHLSAIQSILSRNKLKEPLPKHFIPILYSLGLSEHEIQTAQPALDEVAKFVESHDRVRRSVFSEPETNWIERTIRSLKTSFFMLDWTEILEAVIYQTLPDETNLIIWDSLNLEALEELIGFTSPDVLENYLFLEMIEQLGSKLNSPVASMVKIEPLSCLNAVRQYLGPALIREFVLTRSDKMKKLHDLTQQMFDYMKIVMMDMSHLPWIYTNDRLWWLIVHKTKEMQLIPGYDEQHLNDSVMDKLYSKLNLSDKEYLSNLLAIRALMSEADFSMRLGQPVDPMKFITIAGNPSYINAIYNPEYNTINVNMGLMTSSLLLDPTAPAELNFAVLGFLIGHEMSHALDLNSLQYDEYGDLRESGPEPSTKVSAYQDTFNCIEQQYEGRLIEGTSVKVNGSRTVNENFADIMGYHLAQGALNFWIVDMAAARQIDRKLFWTATASVWCNDPDVTQWEIASNSKYDVHAPNEFRVNLAIGNVNQFGYALQCDPGKPLNPHDKCIFWKYQ